MIPFVVLLILAIGILECITLYDPLKDADYSVRTLKRSVEEGEVFSVESTVTNHSPLPMAFLGLEESFPGEASFPNLPAQYTLRLPPDSLKLPKKLFSTVFLMPRQTLTRRVELSLPARGRYFLRGAELTAGDFLGFQSRSRNWYAFQEIVVLPGRSQAKPAITALGGFLGEISVRRFIMEDPVLTLGFREYTGREPQKQIAWTQSLRAGKLLVKEFDHTLDLSVTVLLDVALHNDPQGEALIEECFRLARTVCETLEQQRIQYGFLTNAMAAGALGHWKSITEGLGESHLMAILEGLGRATYDHGEDFHETLERAARMAEQGRSHILITPRRDAQTEAGARLLESRTGGRVCILEAALPESGKEGK